MPTAARPIPPLSFAVPSIGAYSITADSTAVASNAPTLAPSGAAAPTPASAARPDWTSVCAAIERAAAPTRPGTVRRASRRAAALLLASQPWNLATIRALLDESLPVLGTSALREGRTPHSGELLIAAVLGLQDAVDARLRAEAATLSPAMALGAVAPAAPTRDPLIQAMALATTHAFCEALQRLARDTALHSDGVWLHVLRRYRALRATPARPTRRGWPATR